MNLPVFHLPISLSHSHPLSTIRPMLVFDQLHYLNGGASNAWLHENDGDWVLFDTGMGKRIDAVGYLDGLGVSAEKLKHIVITHADVDHIGGLTRIQRQTGAAVYMTAATAKLVTAGKFPSHGSPLMDWVSATFMKVEAISAEKITIIEAGSSIPLLGGLDVIAAPGHTADHTAFYSPATGILIAGDAILTVGNKLSVSSKLISHDYDQARASAIVLAELNPVIFAAGHGKPYSHDMGDIMALLA